MKIELVSDYIKTNDETLCAVSNYFKAICNALNYDFSNILKVIFADDENYGKEIKKINPNTNYTKTKTHIGLGKTIYLSNINSNVIIINACFLPIIVNTLNKNDFDSYPNRLYLHLINHEIGHCIQHKKIIKDVIDNYQDLNQLSTLPNYYFPILIDEFAANRNIIDLYTDQDVIETIKSFFIDDLVKLSNEYYTNQLSEYDLASTFWLLNVQFAKLSALLIEYPIEKLEEYFQSIHSDFKYKEILLIYKDYSDQVISENDLLFNLLGYQRTSC